MIKLLSFSFSLSISISPLLSLLALSASVCSFSLSLHTLQWHSNLVNYILLARCPCIKRALLAYITKLHRRCTCRWTVARGPWTVAHCTNRPRAAIAGCCCCCRLSAPGLPQVVAMVSRVPFRLLKFL